MKKCSKCKLEKEEDQFNKRSRGSVDGLQSYCIECQKASMRAWEPSDKSAGGRYKVYGISVAEYHAMYEEQEGCCAVCGGPHETLDVDHDHVSGKVRALLCGPCNRGLGMFEDNPSMLRRAASYLTDSVLFRDAKNVLEARTF